MMHWLWDQGHLAWPLFSALVYSAALVLAADYVWRLVTRPIRQVLAAVGIIWLLGMVIIYAVLT